MTKGDILSVRGLRLDFIRIYLAYIYFLFEMTSTTTIR